MLKVMLRAFLIGMLLLGALLPAFGSELVQAQEPPRVTEDVLADFEAIVESEMEYYHIPGMAVAIVEGSEIVYANGFGVRSLETGEPFTPQTQFRIGSTTKSMTSMLVAQLVDEGLLDWDTPVTDIYPDFQTADPELTAKLTVGDLMGMGTGLESDGWRALDWGGWTPDDLFAAVAEQGVAGEYHEHYAYNNEVYASAGYVAAMAAGLEPTLDNYKTLMQERIFDPIGMSSTIITDDTSALGDNVASSYELTLKGGVENPSLAAAVPIHIIAPAGGVWASAEDMAKYVITQLNGGITPDGTQIVSKENLAQTWEPGVSVPVDIEGVEDAAYAMGWLVETYQDIPIRYHDGGWEGYRTQMSVFPEANVGLVIFTNHIYGDISNPALMYAFVQLLYGLEVTATSEARAVFDESFGSLDAQIALLPPPEVELADVEPLLGEYEMGWTVELHEDNTLWAVHGVWQFMLYPIPLPNTYIVGNSVGIGTMVEFKVDGDQVSFTLEAPEQPVIELHKIG